jgi:hypothetical protein
MYAETMFLDCPAWLDRQGAVRCGLPAEVEDRYTMTSTDGPLESARIRCPDGHVFNGPVESLTLVAGRGSDHVEHDRAQVVVAQGDRVALHAARRGGLGRDVADFLRA